MLRRLPQFAFQCTAAQAAAGRPHHLRWPPPARSPARCVSLQATSAMSGDALRPWHDALASVTPTRRLLLPRGHPEGSVDCDVLALLGDSVLKTALMTALGVGSAAGSTSDVIGALTSRVSSRVSNATLAGHAPAALVTPGVPLTPDDLSYLPEHGRATCVEAAVALVYRKHGVDPVVVLAKEVRIARANRDVYCALFRLSPGWRVHLLSCWWRTPRQGTQIGRGCFWSSEAPSHRRPDLTAALWPRPRWRAEKPAAESSRPSARLSERLARR